MGTLRSTTTNQTVGLLITEIRWEASKVAQTVSGEKQHMRYTVEVYLHARRFLCHGECMQQTLLINFQEGNLKQVAQWLSSFPLSKKCAVV